LFGPLVVFLVSFARNSLEYDEIKSYIGDKISGKAENDFWVQEWVEYIGKPGAHGESDGAIPDRDPYPNPSRLQG